MKHLQRLAVWFFASAAPLAPAAALEAVCLPDQVTVGVGERVTVRAFSDAPSAAVMSVTWHVESGDMSATRDSTIVSWRPGKQQDAPLRITADLATGGQSATCSAEIAVVLSPHRGAGDNLVAAALFLPPATPEPRRYGLYSYLLFSRRPQTDEERKRMEVVLDAYLRFHGANALEQAGTNPRQLNATFLPIKQALPEDFDQRGNKASWLRNNYWFERAQTLQLKLLKFPNAGAWSPNGSVWLVSCLQPLGSGADPRPVLVQDLSSVPISSIPSWMENYEAVTTQPRLYDRSSIAKLSLDLRITIARLSGGFKAVSAAFRVLGSDVLK